MDHTIAFKLSLLMPSMGLRSASTGIPEWTGMYILVVPSLSTKSITNSSQNLPVQPILRTEIDRVAKLKYRIYSIISRKPQQMGFIKKYKSHPQNQAERYLVEMTDTKTDRNLLANSSLLLFCFHRRTIDSSILNCLPASQLVDFSATSITSILNFTSYAFLLLIL